MDSKLSEESAEPSSNAAFKLPGEIAPKVKIETGDDNYEETQFIPEGLDFNEEDDSESSDEELIEILVNPNEVNHFTSELGRINGISTEVSVAEDENFCDFINVEKNASAEHQELDEDDIVDNSEDLADFTDYFYDETLVNVKQEQDFEYYDPDAPDPKLRQAVAVKLHRLDEFLIVKYFSSTKNFLRKRMLSSLINKQQANESGGVLTDPIEIEDGRVICHLCSNIYKTKKLLARHIKTFHERSTMTKCDRCDYIGSSNGAVSRHILTVHMNVRLYHCPLCDKVKTEKRYFIEKHLKEEHAIADDDLAKMVKSSTTSRRLDKGQLKKCPECSYSTTKTNYMTKHMLRTHKSRRLPENSCRHCHTEFISDPLTHSCPAKVKANEALQHVEILQDGKTHCPDCDEEYDCLDSLKSHYLESHIVIEMPERPTPVQRKKKALLKDTDDTFEEVVVKPDMDKEEEAEKLLCDQCPFIGSKEDLNWHVKHVHKDRKHQCDHCSYSTNSKEALSNHIKRIHDGIACQLCHLCPSSYWTLKDLGDHLRGNHFEETKHLFCDQPPCEFWAKLKSRRDAHILRVHMRHKNFLCDKCNFKAFIQSELDSHIREKHLKIFRFNCHLCHKERIRMGFPTRKRLHRHLAFAHNVDPKVEDNEDNKDLIMNPPPLDIVEETKKSKRGRRKGAKNRLKLDPDTGQLVRILWKRPKKDNVKVHHNKKPKKEEKGEESVLNDQHPALWWPPLMQNLVN